MLYLGGGGGGQLDWQVSSSDALHWQAGKKAAGKKKKPVRLDLKDLHTANETTEEASAGSGSAVHARANGNTKPARMSSLSEYPSLGGAPSSSQADSPLGAVSEDVVMAALAAMKLRK